MRWHVVGTILAGPMLVVSTQHFGTSFLISFVALRFLSSARLILSQGHSPLMHFFRHRAPCVIEYKFKLYWYNFYRVARGVSGHLTGLRCLLQNGSAWIRSLVHCTVAPCYTLLQHTTSVTSLTLRYLILSLVAKMHAHPHPTMSCILT